MAIEIVDFPIENGGSFHSYVNVYQRVLFFFCGLLGYVGIVSLRLPVPKKKITSVRIGFYPSLPSQFGSVWNYHTFLQWVLSFPRLVWPVWVEIDQLRIINVCKCSKILNI